MYLFILKNYKNQIIEEFCLKNKVEIENNLLKILNTISSTLNTRDISNLIMYHNTNKINLFIQNIDIENIVEEVLNKITKKEFEFIKNSTNFLSYQDLVGWELLNIFPYDNNIYATFQKNSKITQFKLKLLEGDYFKYYEFEENGKLYSQKENPSSSHACFNNQYEQDKIYLLSQKLKGIVLDVEDCVIVTDKGKIGYKSCWYGNKICMVKCEQIIACPLENKMEIELISQSYENAHYKAYQATKFYCVDVLSNRTPSDTYLKENKFSLCFKIIDKRNNNELLSMFSLEEFDFDCLGTEGYKVLEKLKPIIDKINEQGNFECLNKFVYPTIDEFILKFK